MVFEHGYLTKYLETPTMFQNHCILQWFLQVDVVVPLPAYFSRHLLLVLALFGSLTVFTKMAKTVQTRTVFCLWSRWGRKTLI